MEKERGEDVFSLESLGKMFVHLKLQQILSEKFSSSSGQYDTKQLFFFSIVLFRLIKYKKLYHVQRNFTENTVFST
jgi:hypothetical protein